MGSAASVKNYCEYYCCPEETKSISSIIENNSNFNQEKENPSNEPDNSFYNKTITNLIMLKNKDNNRSNSSINNENNKEKNELIDKNDEINNNKINIIDDEIYKKNLTTHKENKKVIFESPKKINLINSITFSKESKIETGKKSNLKKKSKSKSKSKSKKKEKIKANIDKNNGLSTSKKDESKTKKRKKFNTEINIKKESEIITNLEEEKNNKFHTNLLIIPKNESIFDSEVIKCNSTNLLAMILDDINVSEESFRSFQMKSNVFQNEFPKFAPKRQIDNDHIKGNFLMKKMKFKYQGNKDEEGKKLGFGILLYEDTSKLMGNFFFFFLNGVVYFYNCGIDNSTFIGEYRNNIPNGYGVYSRQGLKLEGNNWNKNYINDIGIALWDEGDIYEGEFKNNIKEGIGTYRWEDGASYMGYFKNNQLNGYGYINFANGNSYVGEFNDGYLSGWGEFTWEDGKCYIGNYYKNKKNGFGIFIWSFKPLVALIGFWDKGVQIGFFIKLMNGTAKYFFYQKSQKHIEIGNKGDICRYLNPQQMKYKTFLKKSYNYFENFIKSASKI